jgi:hypothetical protein
MSFYVNSGSAFCQWGPSGGISRWARGLNRVISRDNSQFSSYQRALTLAISLSVSEDCGGWGEPKSGEVLIQ